MLPVNWHSWLLRMPFSPVARAIISRNVHSCVKINLDELNKFANLKRRAIYDGTIGNVNFMNFFKFALLYIYIQNYIKFKIKI